MFIKSEKHPSPPFTRNYLTHKTLNKKVKGEGLKTLFYIYARQGKKSVFSLLHFFIIEIPPQKWAQNHPVKNFNLSYSL